VTSPPRYVLADPAEARAVLRRLANEGWTVRSLDGVPDEPWDLGPRRLVVHARFDAAADPGVVGPVVLVAARGGGVVATVAPGSPAAHHLVADLERIGPVTGGRAEGSDAAATDRSGLTDDHRALLARLAAGESIAAAAAAEFLSLRTANRRIADARAVLGVSSTRAAVVAYSRLVADR